MLGSGPSAQPNSGSGLPAAQPAPAPAPTATLPPPKYVSSPIDTGTGLSIEPFYWYTRAAKPILRGGNTDINPDPGDLNFPTQPNGAIGAKVSIPVSPNGTLRGWYFQTQSTGSTTAPRNLNLLGQEIAGGDMLATRYRIEGFKMSYDYLTYFWKHGNSEMRVKTLYEVQRISFSNEADDFQLDSTGTLVNINPATGTKSLILPTFGVGLEHTLSRHFRWEARASGFALPHRAVLGDLEAMLAFRVSHVELLAGGMFLHYKTNPEGDEYDKGNLYGPYVSLRFYWKKQ